MTVYEIILKKRDGHELSPGELSFILNGFLKGEIPDYQVSALLMAVFLNGMSSAETISLTNLFIASGETADLRSVPGVKVDKHSTGGVGDKVSIILAPVVAAAGVPVPMISGRGLGHSGGTLDKLEAIPGFRVNYEIPEFRDRVQRIGACLIGQTAKLVPLDKKIYALRDVTATIESIPLIAASIMSKKIAEGTDALVLDIKTGQGGFLKNYQQAAELARILITIGEQAGIRTVAYITGMDEPLGTSVGNWLEIHECIQALQGEECNDLMTVTHQLAGTMIYLGHKARSIEEGIKISHDMINSGKAWEKFIQIVQEQEGKTAYLLHPENYPASVYQSSFTARQPGFITAIDARQTGLAAIELGAGRKKTDDPIDPKAGILFHKKVGDAVQPGTPVFTVFTDKPHLAEGVAEKLAGFVEIKAEPAPAKPVILGYLDKSSDPDNKSR